MNPVLNFPSDAFVDGAPPNVDLAADFLELNALFSKERQSLSEDIVNALELAADTEYDEVDTEIRSREDTAAAAVARMSSRRRILSESYPFKLDGTGNVISWSGNQSDLGQTAYLVSLILSNLKSVSPLLVNRDAHPSEKDVNKLRQYFQYLATAAIAAEVGGHAWSFGFPRPDGSGFLEKLTEIWTSLRDGTVHPDPSAPHSPKDDKVDIFAWRKQRDGLPGFLLVAAQVATGKDWKEKSLKTHVEKAFGMRWFSRPPVSSIIAYHVIPFARPDEKFRDDVLVLGNVLHRLRVPLRVREATNRIPCDVSAEAFDLLDGATEWVHSYVERTRAL